MKANAKGVLGWLSGTIAGAIDEAKEARIAGYASQVPAEVGRQRQAFRFTGVAAALGIPTPRPPRSPTASTGGFWNAHGRTRS